MKEAFLEDTLHIRWSKLDPASIGSAVEVALKEAAIRLRAIASLTPKKVTFANTFLALEKASELLDRAWGRVNHLDSVRNSEPLREAHNRLLPKVTAFYTQLFLNDELWSVLTTFSESDAAGSLEPIQARLMEETLRSFRQNGANLEPDKKQRLEEVQSALAEKTQKFSENVLDATNAWDLIVTDESRLAGLPDSARQAAKASAQQKGKGTPDQPAWRFTLQAPSYIPALQYLEDDALRRQIWEALSEIGRSEPYSNAELLPEILKLRQEKAELLGYENFAALVLENRMARKDLTALNFIEDLHERIQDQFKNEVAELEAFKAAETGKPKEALEPWELGFWSEKLRRRLHDFDPELLRPYFAIDNVIGGMFQIAEKLFGIRITERSVVFRDPSKPSFKSDAVEVWHPDVKFYDVHDTGSEHLGSFYADWHPREDKRGGAWMNYLRTGFPSRVTGGDRDPHIGLICGNLTPPVNDKPAQLTHGEVETIFHEFGHLLHHLLGDVEIQSLNGVNVVWDFVELPSQIMENFCWERTSLDQFARHFESEEPIPDELFDRMIAARNFQSGMATMRQLSFAKMDLELHMNWKDFENRDLDEVIDSLLEDYLIPTRTPRKNNSHSFNHLFSSPTGYAAGYYSYKWAEVLDADAFTRFKEAGVLSGEVGREFREKILSQGNARDANELYHDFMGRDPELEALLIRNGLLAMG